MLKFREVGTYKNAVNIGYCTAEVDLKNGMVVTFDRADKSVALPTNGKETGLAIVFNTIEKPEIEDPNKYVIEAGEFPRLFELASLKDRIIDMDLDQVVDAYADIAVGDFLTANDDGQLEVTADVSAYKEYFEVIEKTTYNAEGIAVRVVIGTLNP